jgi:hypothetical protein
MHQGKLTVLGHGIAFSEHKQAQLEANSSTPGT